jgi:branched-chain amino acid transport system permease protein
VSAQHIRIAVIAAAVLALAAFPLVGGKFGVDFVTKMMVFAIFALSLELLVGQVGLVCFGQAAFFGIAAYAAVRLTPVNAPASIWWLAPAAVAASALYALFMGSLSIRTRGVYFIMVTLAFSQMAYYVAHDTPLGGGTDGIYLSFVPSAGPIDLARAMPFYYYARRSARCSSPSRCCCAALRARAAGIRLNEQRTRRGFPVPTSSPPS